MLMMNNLEQSFL